MKLVAVAVITNEKSKIADSKTKIKLLQKENNSYKLTME